MSVSIVGIAGLAGAGKDTAAQVLINLVGFHRMALADPIKEIAAKYFGVDVHAPKTPEVRDLYQRLGTEVGRAYDPECWIKLLEQRIECVTPSIKKVVVPDVRFRNEAEWVLRRNGLMIYVSGRGGLAGDEAQHESERGIDVFDDLKIHQIQNTWTIAILHQGVLGLWLLWVMET